jgi:hypothetical protein
MILPGYIDRNPGMCWKGILREWEQSTKYLKLDRVEFIDIGSKYRDSGFSVYSRN